MIARLDHRPRLTALLALTTAELVVVVIALAALLIRSAPPVPATAAPGLAPLSLEERATGENCGEGCNNYGYDAEHAAALRRAAQTGNGADSAIDRHAKLVAPRYDYYHNHNR